MNDRSTKGPGAKRTIYLALAIIAVVAAAVWRTNRGGGDGQAVAVKLPTLTAEAAAGKPVFERVCAECHGPTAGGSDKGPPLIHRYYEPGHHGDGAFTRAINFGARQHHWSFGNMPAQTKVAPNEVAPVVRYVRELQAANGIF